MINDLDRVTYLKIGTGMTYRRVNYTVTFTELDFIPLGQYSISIVLLATNNFCATVLFSDVFRIIAILG